MISSNVNSPVKDLFYEACFLSAQEELKLVQHIDGCKWDTSLKRRVQHYGYAYDYKSRSVNSDTEIIPLPARMKDIRDKVEQKLDLPSYFNQVIINEYEPGQGISGHVDCVPCFDDIIVSLSLLSSCVMHFSKAGEKAQLLLEAGSILVLSGEARYQWKHGINAVKNDKLPDGAVIPRERRLSLTFRKIISS